VVVAILAPSRSFSPDRPRITHSRENPVVATLPPEVEPLTWLLGTWHGEGRGAYPTIDDFTYREETTFGCIGKPFVTYSQRTWSLGDGGRPLHSETGYLRPRGGGVEAVIAEPSGIVEVCAGALDGERLDLRTTVVSSTPTAKEITDVRRVLALESGRLRVLVDMAAVGQPLCFHLDATLDRQA
jgi:THAP4-like, heme-binding beta-barrel domain